MVGTLFTHFFHSNLCGGMLKKVWESCSHALPPHHTPGHDEYRLTFIDHFINSLRLSSANIGKIENRMLNNNYLETE